MTCITESFAFHDSILEQCCTRCYSCLLLTCVHPLLFLLGEQLNLKPLDIAGARKLQLSTVKALEQQGATAEITRRRFYSVNETGASNTIGAAGVSGKVVLEQLVGAEHMDADGQVHQGKKTTSFKTSADGKSSKKSPLPEIREAK